MIGAVDWDKVFGCAVDEEIAFRIAMVQSSEVEAAVDHNCS